MTYTIELNETEYLNLVSLLEHEIDESDDTEYIFEVKSLLDTVRKEN